jgi:hypothetical protein
MDLERTDEQAATHERRDTGTSDRLYDVVSVLYHALQAAEAAGRYVGDAEARGDDELAQFFRDVIEEQRDCAERAKELLVARLGGDGAAPEDFDDEDDEE